MTAVIVANWKMNPQTLAESKQLFRKIKRGVKGLKNVEVVFCPPFVYFAELGIQNSGLRLGGQDCFWEQQGAFTGEVSPLMLKNFGVEYVIIGHSERRQNLGETDEMINKKLKAALAVSLKPILCVGEEAEQRKKGQAQEVIEFQLKSALSGLATTNNRKPNQRATTNSQQPTSLMVAYEPVWAIGTGLACQPAQAIAMAKVIKATVGEGVPVLYGGSVNSSNAGSYIKPGLIDGLLVGGASLDAKEFTTTIKQVSRDQIPGSDPGI